MKIRTNHEGQTLENKVAVDIQEATQAIGQLETGIKSLKSTINSISKNTGISNFTNQINQANKNANTLSKTWSAVQKTINFSAIYLGARQTYNILRDMNEEAVNYSETVNLFNVSFGKDLKGLNQYYEKALDFQERLEEKLSINIEESMRYQALFNSMTKSMGLSANYAYTLSENMTKLGYDLASLYNIDTESAMTKLRAGLAGQTEPLRELGLDITEQSLKPVAESLGIDRSVRNMSQAEKTILRYIAVLKQATIAQGDFANTMESPANQLRIFNAQVTAFKRNMGNLWQGILGGILPHVNAVMMVINELLKMVAKLFGFEVSSQPVNVSASIGADDLASDLGTAGKKAKELKAQLMGFDEINNISLGNDNSSGSESSSGVGGIDQKLLDALKGYDNLMDSVSNKATEIRDKMLDWLGFTRDVNGKLKWSWKDMDNIAKIITVITGLIGGIYIIGKITKLVQWIKNLTTILKTGAGATTTFGLGIQTIGNFINRVKGGFSGLSGAINKSTGAIGKHSKQVTSANKATSSFAKTGATLVGGLTGIAASSALTYASMKDLTTGEISATEGALKLAGGLAGATASGVLAGSQFGELGMIAGGLAGLITSSITAYVGYKEGIESLGIPVTTLTEGINKLTQEVDANRQAHEQAVQSIKDTYEQEMVEADYADRLSQQLKGLVDANGKVKKGNEERVDFILNELNEALGTEYKLNGNLITKNGEVVDSYEELQGSIKDTIEAKKEEAEQQANLDLYKESLKEQIQLEKDKAKLIEEQAKAQKEYDDLMAKYESGQIGKWTLEHDESCKAILENYVNITNKLTETRDKHREVTEDVKYYTQQLTDEYVKDTGIITSEMIIQQEVTKETLQSLAKENTKAWEQSYNGMNTAVQESMLIQSTTLDTWSPTLQQKWADMAENSATNFKTAISNVEPEIQAQILSSITTTTGLTPEMQEAWNNLATKSKEEFDKALEKMPEETQILIETLTSTVETLSPEQIQKWADLAKNNKGAYDKNLTGLDSTTKSRIQSCVDAINNKQWTAEEAAKGLADAVEKGVDTIDTTEAGRQAVNGVTKGINDNKDSQSLLEAIGGVVSNVKEWFKKLFGIESPSKEMAALSKYIPLGVAKGIDDNTKEAINSIRNMSTALIGEAQKDTSKVYDSMNGILINPSNFKIDTNQFIDYGTIAGNINARASVEVNSLPDQVRQAVIEGMKNARVQIGIEARTDKGIMFKAMQEEADDFAMRTGENPFPVMI